MKLKGKALYFFVSIILIFGIMPISVSAAPVISFDIDYDNLLVGEPITVTADVTGAGDNIGYTGTSQEVDYYASNVKKTGNKITFTPTAAMEFVLTIKIQYTSDSSGGSSTMEKSYYIPVRGIINDISAQVTAPVGGVGCSSYANPGGTGYTCNLYQWRKGSSNGAIMSFGDKFEAGETYCAMVKFEPASYYNIINIPPNVKINGITANQIDISTASGGVASTIYAVNLTAPEQAATLTGVEVLTKPEKLTYNKGEKFDPTGLVLKMNYSDGGWLQGNNFNDMTFSPSTLNTVGTQNITITYQGKTTTLDVTVKDIVHTHSYGTAWNNNSAQHWHECSCGAKNEVAAHSFGDWTITVEATATTEGAQERTCSVCGYVESGIVAVVGHEHNFGSGLKSDAAKHWAECEECGYKQDEQEHTFGEWSILKTATATEEGAKERVCKVCGYTEHQAIPVGTSDADASADDVNKDNGGMLWLIISIAVIVIGGGAAVTVILLKKRVNIK